MPLPEACPKLARRCTAVTTHTETTSLIVHLFTSAHAVMRITGGRALVNHVERRLDQSA